MDTPNGSEAEVGEQLEAAQAFASNMAKVAEQSQAIWAILLESQISEEHPLHGDPLNVMPAFNGLGESMMAHPEHFATAMTEYWAGQAELWRQTNARFWGETEQKPVVEPARGDKRFKSDQWVENAAFDHIKQSYLLTANWLQKTVAEAEGMDERDRKKVSFYTRNFMEAMSPTNFAGLNPDVIQATLTENGDNLVRGLNMMLEDLERGKGKLLIRQTDMDAFAVGRNMAMSPGKVIFQNNIMQLIQYAPTTDKVQSVPILFVPPWINKYYVLDLNTKKSLIQWLVAEGFTVFLISWVNPDEAQKDETWDSYMFDGVNQAIDKVLEETGVAQTNVASYCIGGTMTGMLMAYLGKSGDTRVASTTFFTAQLDFADAGELQVLVDDQTIGLVDEQMEKGYLPAEAMANAFNLLRSSDLIWGYVINNYMLGKEPFPFDLLYWNSDSTAMPAQVHHYYLERFYQDNALVAGELKVRGEPVLLSDVVGPIYHVATKEDHIAPAVSVYRGAKQMTSADVTFVLAGSGHIAGVVNPPDMKKYQYWTGDGVETETLEEWLSHATETAGSWWPHWAKWLRKQSGKKVPARTPGSVIGAIEDAPGSYVSIRFDQR